AGSPDCGMPTRRVSISRWRGGSPTSRLLAVLPPHVLRRLNVHFKLDATGCDSRFLNQRAERFHFLLFGKTPMRTSQQKHSYCSPLLKHAAHPRALMFLRFVYWTCQSVVAPPGEPWPTTVVPARSHS